jgi:hypothetical protein
LHLGNTDDLVYVHNQLGKHPLPKRWLNWAEEYFPFDGGNKLRRIKPKA